MHINNVLDAAFVILRHNLQFHLIQLMLRKCTERVRHRSKGMRPSVGASEVLRTAISAKEPAENLLSCTRLFNAC